MKPPPGYRPDPKDREAISATSTQIIMALEPIANATDPSVMIAALAMGIESLCLSAYSESAPAVLDAVAAVLRARADHWRRNPAAMADLIAVLTLARREEMQ